MYADDLDDYQNETPNAAPPIAGAADPEYTTRIDAARVTALWQSARERRESYKRSDGLPLFPEGPDPQDSFAFGARRVEVD